MALINCGECGHSISDKAGSCPKCGYPLSRMRIASEVGKVLSSAGSLVDNKLNLTSEKFGILKDRIEDCLSPISLRRVNGIGLRIGSLQFIYLNGSPTRYALGLLVFTVLFTPVIPLGLRIVEPVDGAYRFIGQLSLQNAREVFEGGIATRLVWGALFEACLFIAMFIGVILLVAAFMGLFYRY